MSSVSAQAVFFQCSPIDYRHAEISIRRRKIEGLREEMTSTEEKVTKLEDQISSKNEGNFLKSNRISELERELKTHRQDMLLKSNRISELERELATHRQDMLLEKGTQFKLQTDLSLREKDIRELRQVNWLAAERMHRARQILGSSDDESGLQHTKTESACVNHDSGLSKEKRNPQKKTRYQPDKTDREELAVSQDAMSAKGIQSTLGSDWPEQLLKWATETGDAEVARFVCKRKPKSHRQYLEALNITSIKGHSKIIKILLEALPGIRPPAGLVLQAAIGRKYQLAEQILLADAPVSSNDAIQIHYAIEGDDAIRNGVLGSVQLGSFENILTEGSGGKDQPLESANSTDSSITPSNRMITACMKLRRFLRNLETGLKQSECFPAP